MGLSLEMQWGSYDGIKDLAPGATARADVGERTGSTLYVSSGAKILSSRSQRKSRPTAAG